MNDFFVSPELLKVTGLLAVFHTLIRDASFSPFFKQVILINTVGSFVFTAADAALRVYQHHFPPRASGLPIGPRLARSNINSLQPYRCARDDYSSGILLDANENSLGPPLSSNPNALERYPDPAQIELKRLWGSLRGVSTDKIFVGNGSDEAIDLIIRCFCSPEKDAILITPPTYGMYKVCAVTNDVRIISAPLHPDFTLDVPSVLKCRSYVKIIFICSPGNPTARSIPNDQISKVARNAPGAIVVVDEAYVDFSSDNSAVELLEKHDNIVVMQTMSKVSNKMLEPRFEMLEPRFAVWRLGQGVQGFFSDIIFFTRLQAFGLAGIRCGFAIGHPSVIQIMNNVKAPYNVNKLTSATACSALGRKAVDKFKANVKEILKEREYVTRELLKLDKIVDKVFSR